MHREFIPIPGKRKVITRPRNVRASSRQAAGDQPERILVNSDLDWGQDLLRLASSLRALGVQNVSIAYNGSADLTRRNLPPFRILSPHEPTTGWIAISLHKLKIPGDSSFSWLDAYKPVAMVGRSIWLYYIPEKPTEHPEAVGATKSDL